jgi:hypothetical protein
VFWQKREVFSVFCVFLETSEILKSYIFQGLEEDLFKRRLNSAAWRTINFAASSAARYCEFFFNELFVKIGYGPVIVCFSFLKLSFCITTFMLSFQ